MSQLANQRYTLGTRARVFCKAAFRFERPLVAVAREGLNGNYGLSRLSRALYQRRINATDLSKNISTIIHTPYNEQTALAERIRNGIVHRSDKNVLLLVSGLLVCTISGYVGVPMMAVALVSAHIREKTHMKKLREVTPHLSNFAAQGILRQTGTEYKFEWRELVPKLN